MLAAIAAFQALVAFSTVAAGTQSGIDEPRQVVVRTAADWTALWRHHAPEGVPPVIDFTQSIVAGVFLGTRPTAGFEVEIVEVRRETDRTRVEYVERRPPPGAMVALVLTSPFHLVRLPRDTAEVEFRLRTVR